ncbi:MAG: hypothetical protein Q8L60_05445 [Gammaproteobacteria bacterium]|nr:hypothetical protein [Gammaproteobacteria bacterium]MDP2140537.1 hypothetical protein [Gammaproteobacteria bacterium]MDP2347306.1 hypothetical protein [Gammaproteobacteria bacterium]
MKNIRTGQDLNSLENWSVHSQLLWDVSGVIGLLVIKQELESDPFHRKELGLDLWRYPAFWPGTAGPEKRTVQQSGIPG